MGNRLEKAPNAGAGKPWILREAVDKLHSQGRGRKHNIGMICRDHCAACCIAPSISSPIPGMPAGKPAGVRCVQLDEQDRCKIFGQPERPAVCGSLQPSEMMCGESREQAMRWLGWMEAETAPPLPQYKIQQHAETAKTSP